MATMRAFVTDGKGSGSVKSVPIPALRQGEIIVKVHYAALNPGDWKLVEGDVLDGPAPPGLIAGCDFSGSVEEANDTHWKKGQRVGGWVHGATFEGIGSFAEFVNIEASLVFAVPDNVNLQQASTISLAFATATQAMYQHLGFLDPTLSPVNKDSLHAVNPYVKAESMIAFTVFGRELGDEYTMFDNAGPATPNEKSAWEGELLLVTESLERGDIQPNPVREVGTLDDVLEAFRLSKEGKLSAEKAILKITDSE
ncbi:hypothetical protein ACHAP7_007340 [Fusarium lateritium]